MLWVVVFLLISGYMDYQWENSEIDPLSEDWGNNRDYQEGFNEVGNLSVEEKLVDLLREYLQGDEESLSSNQAMVGSSQASQISNEGYSNNLGYIDSGEIDSGALDGMIGDLIQSSHHTQEVQLLQQAQVESWESFMWENDRKSSEMDTSIHKIEAQIGQLAELLQGRRKGRFPSQPEDQEQKQSFEVEKFWEMATKRLLKKMMMLYK